MQECAFIFCQKGPSQRCCPCCRPEGETLARETLGGYGAPAAAAAPPPPPPPLSWALISLPRIIIFTFCFFKGPNIKCSGPP